MGLEEFEPRREIEVSAGQTDLRLSLPLQSVSLLILSSEATS